MGPPSEMLLDRSLMLRDTAGETEGPTVSQRLRGGQARRAIGGREKMREGREGERRERGETHTDRQTDRQTDNIPRAPVNISATQRTNMKPTVILRRQKKKKS